MVLRRERHPDSGNRRSRSRAAPTERVSDVPVIFAAPTVEGAGSSTKDAWNAAHRPRHSGDADGLVPTLPAPATGQVRGTTPRTRKGQCSSVASVAGRGLVVRWCVPSSQKLQKLSVRVRPSGLAPAMQVRTARAMGRKSHPAFELRRWKAAPVLEDPPVTRRIRKGPRPWPRCSCQLKRRRVPSDGDQQRSRARG